MIPILLHPYVQKGLQTGLPLSVPILDNHIQRKYPKAALCHVEAISESMKSDYDRLLQHLTEYASRLQVDACQRIMSTLCLPYQLERWNIPI